MASVKPTPSPADAGPAAPPAETSLQELKVTGHMMSLPTGLFCFVNEANPTSARYHGMPGVRVSPPPSGGQNLEIVGFRPDGWLDARGDAALVRVHRGPAQVLVTIYQHPNQPGAAPKLQVRQLLSENDGPQAPVPVAAPAPQRMDFLAHIQGQGDVGARFGEWLGQRGGTSWVEGFAISAPEGVASSDITYQAVLGRGWLSPWVEAGEYCGSRGMALPLLGLRIRLTGQAAEQYDLTYSASFVGGATAGPVGNDETCEGDTLAPLEALQVTLTPRTRKATKAKR